MSAAVELKSCLDSDLFLLFLLVFFIADVTFES